MAAKAILALLLCLVAAANGKKGFGSGEQEWGYVTVRPHAHMFWWLYYTIAKVPSYFEKPLLIWLQGGPGGSSTGYGNFEELGPLDLHLQKRNFTWINEYNVLFIDNPVGTGFSYVERQSVYTKTNAEIATDLLECIKGFLKAFPGFQNVPTYVTAESYGGKMAAEFANVWYKAQQLGEITSNLKGVALGDSWISPIDSVLTWAPFLLNTGMVDKRGYREIAEAAKRTSLAVNTSNWITATNLWAHTEEIILKVTNNIDFYNILYRKQPKPMADLKDANSLSKGTVFQQLILEDPDALLNELMNTKVKTALGLNVTWGNQSSTVFAELYEDFMKPTTEQVQLLLNNTNLEVFIFTAQLDLIVDTPGTLLWVERLRWKNSANWLSARRIPLVVNNVIEGYVKEYGNLKMYWFNRSGHMAPRDNPDAMASMLRHLTGGQ
ncbi:retinoid-inducible serine carboxypeptidase [Orussus abietinus]|uniref:retinoid-inducible serine carboxypeptidase n=1 Tax=Orussus abietinus TaxID=222816 RepID=UPI0006265230|nr:retinoid-inducible serine carboxypeptidase [Orussus abietinus]